MRSHSSYLFGIGHPLLVDFGLCAPIRLVFFDIGHLLLVNFDCASTRLVFLTLVSHCWWTLTCAKVHRQQTFRVNCSRYG